MSGFILYQHRDSGVYFRKVKGIVERFTYDGKWVIDNNHKPSCLNHWPFERLGWTDG